jgi:hypothetical protein
MNEMMYTHHSSNKLKLLLLLLLVILLDISLSSFNILSNFSIIIPSGNDGIEAIKSSKELKGVDDWLSNNDSCSYERR